MPDVVFEMLEELDRRLSIRRSIDILVNLFDNGVLEVISAHRWWNILLS